MKDSQVIKNLTETSRGLREDIIRLNKRHAFMLNESFVLKASIKGKDLGLDRYRDEVKALNEKLSDLMEDNKTWRIAYQHLSDKK